MACILCLKTAEADSSNVMRLVSEEAKSLEVTEIVAKHIWPITEYSKNAFICKECWRCLFDFHQFFERIQQAHQMLTKAEQAVLVKVEQVDEDQNSNGFEIEEIEALAEQPIIEMGANADGSSDEEAAEDTLTVAAVLKRPKKTLKAKKPLCSLKKKSKAKRQPLRKRNNIVADDCQNDEEKHQQSIRRRDLSKFDDFIAENIKLICSICQLDCDNFTTLCLHFRNVHNSSGYVKCCGKKFLRRGILVDHLHTHQNPEYFKCEICSKVLADRRCLEFHRQTHEEKIETSTTFKCEICSKGFSQRLLYVRHLENHTPREQRKFVCTICAKRFSSKHYLKNHENVVHLNKYSRVCDICGKKIMGWEAFRHHQQSHEGQAYEIFNCDICGFAAKTKYGLGRHKRLKHNEDYQKPQQCSFCTKISPNKEALMRHINYMHNLQRNHKCSICEVAFKRPKQLKEHLTTHTGDVLYFCTYCPKTFNSNANMYAHRKRKHPKEWAQSQNEKLLKISTKMEGVDVEAVEAAVG